MTERQIPVFWTGTAFEPRGSFHAARCAEWYGAGETVMMTVENMRSERSHRHYFAAIAEAWTNLPEKYAMEPWAQSPEHLRKYALIKTGFCETTTYACNSAAEAARWAAFMRPVDEYSIVVAKGFTVVRYTARSQSYKAMPGGEFQRSKQSVLDFIAGLIGVPAAELVNAGAAA